jgi:hypothetical protein
MDDRFNIISTTRVLDVAYRVHGPYMTGNIQDACITLQTPLNNTALTASHAHGEGPLLEAVEAFVHPTTCRFRWDLQQDETLRELAPGFFVTPIGQASTDAHANLLDLVLKDARENGVYTRVGYFELVWSYGEEPWHVDVERVRWRNGRVARDDMLEVLGSFPIQTVMLK